MSGIKELSNEFISSPSPFGEGRGEVDTITSEHRTALFAGNKRLLNIEAVAKQKNFFENAIANKSQEKSLIVAEKKEERKSLSS